MKVTIRGSWRLRIVKRIARRPRECLVESLRCRWSLESGGEDPWPLRASWSKDEGWVTRVTVTPDIA